MTAVQAVALVAVAVCGTLVVVARNPTRQALASGVFGFATAVALMALEAPDVGLAQLAVSAIGVPIMIIITLGKLREHDE
jgi:uncharacterized MnhB-related membrane protein